MAFGQQRLVNWQAANHNDKSKSTTFYNIILNVREFSNL